MSSITGKVNSKGEIAGSVSPSSGVKNYEDLAGLPSINGVKVSGDKIAADYGLSLSVFIINFSRKEEDDGTYTYSADKTFQEVKNAYEQGRTLIGFSYSGKQLALDTANPSFRFMFGAWYPSGLRYETFSLMLTEQVLYNDNSIMARDQILGGVKADSKTDEDTIPARIGEDGKLYVAAQEPTVIVNVHDGEQPIRFDKTYSKIIEYINSGRDVVVGNLLSPYRFSGTMRLDAVDALVFTRFVIYSVSDDESRIKIYWINENDECGFLEKVVTFQ